LAQQQLGFNSFHWIGCWKRWIWLSIKKGNVLMEDSGSRVWSVCDICACDSNPWQREHNDRDSLHAPKREKKRVCVCHYPNPNLTLILLIYPCMSNPTTCSGAHTLRRASMGTRKKRARAWACLSLTHLPWHYSIALDWGYLSLAVTFVPFFITLFTLFSHCHCHHIWFINQIQRKNVFK